MKNTVQNLKDVLNTELKDLAQKRDELKVQIALGSKEAKDEWEKVEKKFYEFQQRVKTESNALENAFDDSLETIKHEKNAAKRQGDSYYLCGSSNNYGTTWRGTRVIEQQPELC